MKYGSRKFILALLTLADSSVLLAFGAIDADVWKAVVLGTVGVYIAANVAQRAVDKKATP